MSTNQPFAASRSFATDRSGRWYAWHDFTIATPTLYVTGECCPDIPGVGITLRRAVRQGHNPRILMLEKCVVVPADGMVTVPAAVRYDERTVTKYTQVHIEPDALFIDVVVTS